MKNKSELIRVDPIFKKELEQISIERIKKGTDLERNGFRRITMAMRRLNDWNMIKERIINAEFKDE